MLDKMQIADLHYRRGVILEQAGRIAEAIEEYRQALQDNPRLRAAHLALANYYTRNGLIAKAADAWAEAVNIDPDYDTLANLASAYIDLQRYEEARAILQECLRWIPDDVFASFELAYIDYVEGNYQAAHDQLIELRPLYNDEWQLHHLLGNSQARLGLYDAAMASFGRAMLLTSQSEHTAELQASIDMIERMREFPQHSTLKEQLYAEHGLICLGSSYDNGLHINRQVQVNWTYSMVAMTLQRWLRLGQHGLWSCTALLALNRTAEPLAQVLSQRLSVPIRSAAELGPSDIALVVCGTIDNGQMLQTISERVSSQSIVLALTLGWEPEADDTLPDVIGLQAQRSSYPWSTTLTELRQRGAPSTEIDALVRLTTTTLQTAWDELLPETNADEQVRWYTEEHRAIRLPGASL